MSIARTAEGKKGQEQALQAFEEAHDGVIQQFRKDLSAALRQVWRLEVRTSSDTGNGPRMVLGGRNPDSLEARAAEGGGDLTPVMTRLGRVDLETLDALITRSTSTARGAGTRQRSPLAAAAPALARSPVPAKLAGKLLVRVDQIQVAGVRMSLPVLHGIGQSGAHDGQIRCQKFRARRCLSSLPAEFHSAHRPGRQHPLAAIASCPDGPRNVRPPGPCVLNVCPQARSAESSPRGRLATSRALIRSASGAPSSAYRARASCQWRRARAGLPLAW